MLVFRLSKEQDVEAATRIAEDGKASLKAMGVNQWQRGNYPSREVFLQDVKDGIGYVVEEDGKVAAVCAVTDTPDASYGVIDGKWLTDGTAPYATIHRSAVDPERKGKGIIGYLFAQVGVMAIAKNIGSIRIDTHEDNKPMRRALEKAGFQFCGRIVLQEGDEVGDPRLAYELLLTPSSKN